MAFFSFLTFLYSTVLVLHSSLISYYYVLQFAVVNWHSWAVFILTIMQKK